MMSTRFCRWSLSLRMMAGAALLFAAFPSAGAPYASKVTDNEGSVSFVLNEPAGNVIVILGGGAATQDLGALGKGSHSFNRGAHDSFEIVVTNETPSGWTQISDDANPLLHFSALRGVAVNRNAASPQFGRVYLANAISQPSQTTGRPVGDGIYMLNADLTDALGQGNTALTGGLNFSTGGGFSPYRISVGQDNNLYIPDWSFQAGNLYVTDADVSAGSGRFVLKPLTGEADVPVGAANNHGSINRAIATGSLSQGNLAVLSLDTELQDDRETGARTQMNSVWRYNVGAGPLPHEGDPVRVFTPGVVPNSGVNSTALTATDMDRGENGYLYITQYRPNGENSGLIVTDAQGAHLWNSRHASTNGTSETIDILRGAQSVAVSPDQSRAAVLRQDGLVWILPLIDGIPDLAARQSFEAFPPTATVTARVIAFDAAGNVYAIRSASDENIVRVFSPGGNTVATTRSNGTFSMDPDGGPGEPGDLVITAIRIAGANVEVDFVGTEGDTAPAFRVHSAATVTGTYQLNGSAVISTRAGDNAFRATLPTSGSQQFYRIHRN